MGAAVAVGYGIDLTALNLSRYFKSRSKTGGELPKGKQVWDRTHDYFTPVMASADAAQAYVAVAGVATLNLFGS